MAVEEEEQLELFGPGRLAERPYCMRHALAADMKASGMGAAEISAGLGHCSDVTKQYYGAASQGGGARSAAPSKVEAAEK